jgi:hypothetical protein
MAKSTERRDKFSKVTNARQLAQLRETLRQKVQAKPKALEDQGK